MQYQVRPPAVAGLFYPASADGLQQLVETQLADALPLSMPSRPPRAFVVPHAGLVYSGPVAARAYLLLGQACAAAQMRRIILLGPNHRVPLVGLAATTEEHWQTPLGVMEIDRPFLNVVCARFDIAHNAEAHRPEHSLEVQLPFLQLVAPQVSLVPLLVGPGGEEEARKLIRFCWQQTDTLVLVSTDLSHYHSWAEARRLDAVTDRMIIHLDNRLGSEQACGCHALNALLAAASEASLHMECLGRMNSGDTAGDKSQVVGYGSYVCY
ncbi:AmmeMemoRadiSam system protein B [Marinobacterium weihaiense]|uniref:MEMO1 family protein KTN04_00950 n=1 Tax=Marinobacterium weihaiense TaxID=2851016 RepID=A0ABS6M6K2_9GAMM|nr:AmmeMemoRadiSam system protein B [Marinobacterium weihaiense]MBV0931908.1 AmmeMemoRadiSam system protein B [Marinobacterium weihaiense]